MISFVVYQTKIVNNKLTFEYCTQYDEYDDAVKAAESSNDLIVIPFDDDDGDNPETYFQDKE